VCVCSGAVSEATPAAELVSFPGQIGSKKPGTSSAPHFFGSAPVGLAVAPTCAPGPGAYPALPARSTATGRSATTGTAGAGRDAADEPADAAVTERGVYYRKVRRRKELRQEKRWRAECEARRLAQTPKVTVSQDTLQLRGLIDAYKQKQEELARKGRPEAPRYDSRGRRNSAALARASGARFGGVRCPAFFWAALLAAPWMGMLAAAPSRLAPGWPPPSPLPRVQTLCLHTQDPGAPQPHPQPHRAHLRVQRPRRGGRHPQGPVPVPGSRGVPFSGWRGGAAGPAGWRRRQPRRRRRRWGRCSACACLCA
jgi:hypothetical protein